MTKPKSINYRVIEREEDEALYDLLNELISENHDELAEAKIALAWRFGWKKDVDGRLTLGQWRKASDLDRQLHDFDAIILINHEAWSAAEFTPEQQAALLDHELCHGALDRDQDGEPKEDETGRKVYRTRKHDVEEFVEVIERHGFWKTDLQRFAVAALEAKEHPLFRVKEAVENLRPKKGSGVDAISLTLPGKDPVTLEARE